jgi:hypothetical protein
MSKARRLRCRTASPVTALSDRLVVGIVKAHAKMGPPSLRYCAYEIRYVSQRSVT